MNFTKFVEEEKRKARLKNIEELRKDINKPRVQEKINNHVKAFEGLITAEEIKDGIMNNLIIASKFIKDPGRQNISEKLAAEVLGLEKLPAARQNCIRFNDEGDIVWIKGTNTKSADFIYNGYYATQKYTDNEGGSQDNQFADVVDFLKRGSIKHKVAAIVDGAYWDTHRPLLEETFADNPNVLITSVTEITENI